MWKKIAKGVVKGLGIPLTQNIKYDLDTEAIVQKVCKSDTNCIDVGSLDGDFIKLFKKCAPEGKHFAFEPIPAQYGHIMRKYGNLPQVSITNAAVSNEAGTATFNYVVSNPSYSGLEKRRYDRDHEEDTAITVKTVRLDDVIPADVEIGVIKIDVEGAELGVLKGGQKLIAKWQPVVIFEFGLGGSDVYGTTPEDIFTFFQSCNMQIATLKGWLKQHEALSLEQLSDMYHNNKEFYFVADSIK